jgi:hypothetical protein
MIVLLASGQQAVACNICHGADLAADDYVAITPEIHVCSGCQPYQSQSVSFFAWYVRLEKLYKQQGQEHVPRSGRYAADWPIQSYNQGLTPEDAIAAMEAAKT